jgi:hypothetical protein
MFFFKEFESSPQTHFSTLFPYKSPHVAGIRRMMASSLRSNAELNRAISKEVGTPMPNCASETIRSNGGAEVGHLSTLQDSEQDTDSHQVSPRSAPLRTPVDLDLLSNTEEAFDVQSRRKLAPPTSIARSLPAVIASFDNLRTLGLDAGVWDLCCQMGFQSVLRTSNQRQPTCKGGPEGGVAFTKLTEFEVKGASVGRGVVRSLEKMVGLCPALQKLVLCGELGRTKVGFHTFLLPVSSSLDRHLKSSLHFSLRVFRAVPLCEEGKSIQIHALLCFVSNSAPL